MFWYNVYTQLTISEQQRYEEYLQKRPFANSQVFNSQNDLLTIRIRCHLVTLKFQRLQRINLSSYAHPSPFYLLDCIEEPPVWQCLPQLVGLRSLVRNDDMLLGPQL